MICVLSPSTPPPLYDTWKEEGNYTMFQSQEMVKVGFWSWQVYVQLTTTWASPFEIFLKCIESTVYINMIYQHDVF